MARKTAAVERPAGPPRVILLTGADTDRKQVEAQGFLNQVEPDFAEFDAEMIDGSGASAERILSAAATVPLASERRVVLVRDTQQLDTEEQKRLALGLERLPQRSVLILLTGAPVVEDGKVRRATVVATELTNAVKKLGEVRDFGLPKVEDLRGYLVTEAKRCGKTLEPAAIALLCQVPADDVRHVGVELEKAILHAGSAPRVTADDVEATITRGPDEVIFKLCDAVGGRKPKEALEYLGILFRGGGRPDSVAPRTLVLLARQIRLIAQFRYLGEKRMAGRGAGPLTDDIRELLPSEGAAGILGNARTVWMADKYVAQARLFTLAELTERMEKLLQADLMLKGIAPGGDNPKAVLQRLVVELC